MTTNGRAVEDLSLVLKQKELEPEQMLPAQFFRYDGCRAVGERKLMFELLAGALHDLDSPDKIIRSYSARWLLSGDRGDLTCEAVCEFLNLDYDALIVRIKAGLKLRRRQTTRNYDIIEPRSLFPDLATYGPTPE
jgi:hypothetical protein